MIDNRESGVFLPQNEEYVSSRELVKRVSSISGHKVLFTGIFNPVLKLLSKNTYVNKVFGNLTIDKNLSKYKQKYCRYSFEESIRLTEGK